MQSSWWRFARLRDTALHITQRWDQLWLPIFSFARLRHNAARRICTHCRGRRMCWGSTCWECEDKISLKTSVTRPLIPWAPAGNVLDKLPHDDELGLGRLTKSRKHWKWRGVVLAQLGSRGTHISGQPRHSHQWAAEALTSVGSRGTHISRGMFFFLQESRGCEFNRFHIARKNN